MSFHKGGKSSIPTVGLNRNVRGLCASPDASSHPPTTPRPRGCLHLYRVSVADGALWPVKWDKHLWLTPLLHPNLHLYSILTWKALELCLNLGVFLGRKNHLRAELSHSFGSFQYKLCFQETHTAKLLYIRSGNVQEPGSKSPTSGKEQRAVLPWHICSVKNM